jgi:HlyD family secretion protein
MNKRTKIWVGVALALVLLSVAGFAIQRARQRGPEVRVEAVSRRDLISTVTASGIIEPTRKVDISADLSGRVIELAVEEGQMVSRGDLLLRIDPTSYQAAVRRAEAAVAQVRAQEAQARANFLQAQNAASRAQRLAADRLISEQEMEQALTNAEVADAQYQSAQFSVRQAEASLLEARDMFEKTTIRAPMAGRVTRLNIEEGETAIVGTMNNPGSLLLTIADLSVMAAAVQVDETEIPFLNHGDSAIVRIDAFPDQTFSGRVTRISSSALQQGSAPANQAPGQARAVDFEVIVTIDAPPPDLRPDLSATAEVITATRQNVLAVPIIAVTVRDGEGRRFQSTVEDDGPLAVTAAEDGNNDDEVEGVFIITDGRAQFVPVRVGIAGDQYFEVEDGLDEGDTVVAGPYAVVRDLEQDDRVRVAQPEEDDQ